MHNGGPHGHHVDLLERSSEEAAGEVLGWTERTGPKYLLVVLVLAAVAALGVVGFGMKAADGGLDSHHPWGYLAAALAFIMTTSLSAPLVAIAPRFGKAHWNRYVSRIAETWAVVGLLSILIMVPLLLTLPSAEHRQTLLMYNKAVEGWPVGAPHVYVALVLVFTAINGFGLLWASAIPDFALARSRMGGLRGAIYSKLALGWVGSKRQWRALRAGLGVLGALSYLGPDGQGYRVPQYWRFTIHGDGGLAETAVQDNAVRLWRGGAESGELFAPLAAEPGVYLDDFLTEVAGAAPRALSSSDVLRASRWALQAQHAADHDRFDAAL